MKCLDLFSGIGGFALGLESAGMQTAAFCEREPFARRVLAKHWPDMPIYDDVRELTGDRVRRDVGAIDLICGGFPCQPFSQAGKRRGADDDRHLWPEMCRIVDELRPAWVLGENVAGLVSMGLDTVLSDLEALGYACRAFIVPAVAVDAPHRRDRVWIVAHADRDGEPVGAEHGNARTGELGERLETLADAHGHRGNTGTERAGRQARANTGFRSARPTLANAERNGLQGQRPNGADPGSSGLCRGAGRHQEQTISEPGPGHGEGLGRSECGAAPSARWLPEPGVGRVANGIPARVDRLKCLGNAVVPQVVERIGRAIMMAAAQ